MERWKGLRKSEGENSTTAEFTCTQGVVTQGVSKVVWLRSTHLHRRLSVSDRGHNVPGGGVRPQRTRGGGVKLDGCTLVTTRECKLSGQTRRGEVG